MSTVTHSFNVMLACLNADEQQAVGQIYNRFIDTLIGLAARKLDRRLGAKADPEDVALSAFEAFSALMVNHKVKLHNWKSLLGLLAHITLLKCLNRNRDLRRKKRDETEAVTFNDWQAVNREPGPDDEASLAELLEKCLAELPPEERAVIASYMKAITPKEIAREVNLTERTVQRIIERFKKRLLKLVEIE